ncbi:MAG: nucleotidyltransferase family protein [Oscillospiraceae bacterium]|nr:nucleotidyltransferase family protein [Oscillospiraceae bacterium]
MSSISTEQNLILSALSAALFEKSVRNERTVNWDALFQECVSQTVLPIVFSVLRDDLPEEISQKWQPVYHRLLGNNIRVISAHSNIHKLLSPRYVILKGCAAARYYPKPNLRTMGDVDFLVDRADLDSASEILQRAGMERTDQGSHDFHRNFTYQKVSYEMHWEAPGIPKIGGERIRELFRDTLEKAVLVGNSYFVPSDLHHGMILLLHNASHMTAGGIGLRHLCDWAVYIEKMTDAFVIGELTPALKVCGLWEYARVLTAMSASFLGATERDWASGADEGLLDSLMDDIWSGGNFGYKDAHRLNLRVLNRNTESRKVERRAVIPSLMSEIHLKAKKWYPALMKFPLTVPLAWGAVSFRYFTKLLRGERSPIRLKDARTAKMRRELFEQLKLFEE